MQRLKPLYIWFGVALAVIVLAISCTLVSEQADRDITELRAPFPAGTATPVSYQHGIVQVRNFNTTYTPFPGQVGDHKEIYWHDAVPAIANTPNWNAAKTRVAYNASQGQSTWLSIGVYEGAPLANPRATDSLFLPSGVATVTYNQGAACGDDHAPDYRSGSTYRTAMATTVAHFCDTFDSDANVAGYQIDAVGFAAETRNINPSVCTEGQMNFQKTVSCGEYLDYLEWITDLWRTECPNKVIYVGGMQGMCYDYGVDNTWKANKYLLPYLAPPTPDKKAGTEDIIDRDPYFIGYKWNGSMPDWDTAYCTGFGCNEWGVFQAGIGRSDLGGVAFELDRSSIDSDDQQGHAEFTGYAAIMHGANTFWVQEDWLGDFSAEALEVITSTLGTDASNSPSAWIVFRDWEYPESVRSATFGYSFSGIPGPFEHLASVTYATVSAEPTRYCAPSVATAVAARPTDAIGTPTPACQAAITTPSPPEFRQAWGWEANDRIGILIDDDWVVGTTFTGILKITYLDAGTDTFTVHWTTSAGAQSSTVTKGNTNDWVTSDITLSGALLNGGQSTGGDIEIRMATGAEIIHRVWLKWDSAVSTPVPSSTPTLQPTSTRTSTATPAAGTGTPTMTPTPVAKLVINYTNDIDTHTIWRYSSLAKNFLWMENLLWDGEVLDQTDSAVLLKVPAFSTPASYTHTEIVSATLYMNFSGSQSALRLAYLEKEWNDDATWGDTGGATNPVWSTGGALGQDIDWTAYQYFYTDQATYPIMLPISIDVSNDVQAWHDGDTNNGWVIHAVDDPVDCDDCYGVTLLAGDGYPNPTRRPWLSVNFGLSESPSATPTPTNTPTLPATATATTAAVNTATATATPALTYTPTPTPNIPTPDGWSAPPLRLNEVCNAPLRDHNFDGDIDSDDRAVELVNWGANLGLEHYYLAFSTGTASCSGTSRDNIYFIPRFTVAPAYSYKVFFQSQLKDAEGDDITIPIDGSVALCHSNGKQLDFLEYNYQGHDKCWRRSPNATGGWSQDDPTLGKSNR